MLSYRDLCASLRTLGLRDHPVIAHASLKAFGQIEHGAIALLGAVLESVWALVMPTFTYKTMLTPAIGPPNNALTYGSSQSANRMAEMFCANMAADPLMGILPETLRIHPQASRTHHPILSFSGINADRYLEKQTMFEPLAPIGALARAGGWVLLLGVDHSVNTSIHYAEKLAGRRQFLRWALTQQGIVECPGFPGCSLNFQIIAPKLEKATRQMRIGQALVQAVRLESVFETVSAIIKNDPLALLCQQQDCERCGAIRNS